MSPKGDARVPQYHNRHTRRKTKTACVAAPHTLPKPQRPSEKTRRVCRPKATHASPETTQQNPPTRNP
ncbi:hypothetical protein [Kingella potus]|uniref:hypothetical protein n=1 Tax=Kingella potus TaxID=265175 RepID=UPI001FD5B9B1|nr:hypothetical protein [Kingella potus]UOP00214.1 hypothetical protein LVJ84_09790 [Kingella potus]